MEINRDMLNGVILSIRPIYNDLIVRKEKLYEFRNFKPKFLSNYFWVYESSPNKQLKYLMRIAEPVVFPDKLNGISFGVDRFNTGEMKSKYAYKIIELYQLEKPLSMIYLQKNFNFTPPQAYTYLQRNLKLQKYIAENVKLKKII